MSSDANKVPLDLIEDPFIAMRSQTDDGDLDELMSSMREIGLVEPIVLRKVGDRYEVIAGHRRTRAARLLGWSVIEAKIVEANDEAAIAMRLAENISRKDVDPVDQACFIGEVMTRYNKTPDEMAKMLHHSHEWVNERIEVFNMPDYLQQFLRERRLPLGAALWINRIENERTRHYYAFWAAQNGASVAAAKAWHDQLAARSFEFHPDEQITIDPQTQTQRVRASTKCHLCGKDVFLDEADNVFIHRVCP